MPASASTCWARSGIRAARLPKTVPDSATSIAVADSRDGKGTRSTVHGIDTEAVVNRLTAVVNLTIDQ